MVLTLAAHYNPTRSFKNNPIQGPTSDQPNQDLGGWNPGMCVSQMSLVSLTGCQVSSPRDKDAASFSKSLRPAHMRVSGRRAPLQALLPLRGDGDFSGSPSLPRLGREPSASLIPFQHFPGFLSPLKREAGCWQ